MRVRAHTFNDVIVFYGQSTGRTKTSYWKRYRQYRVRRRRYSTNVSVQSCIHQVSIYAYPLKSTAKPENKNGDQVINTEFDG